VNPLSRLWPNSGEWNRGGLSRVVGYSTLKGWLTMRKIGAFGAVAGLAVIAFTASPADAFGLRIGPFHIGIPIPHHHHYGHRSLYMRGNPARDETSPRDQAISTRDQTWALLYPDLALSAIYQNVFLPAKASLWPFGYQDIFSTAFSKATTANDRRLCTSPDDAKAIVGSLRSQIAPTAAQTAALQKLGEALGAASNAVARSCPASIPAQPVARLQLMEAQIEGLATALEIVRQPLQDFEHGLNDEQKARFAAMIRTPAATETQNASETAAASCGSSPTEVDTSISQIDQAVQPTDDQRSALDQVKQSFTQAASELEAHCPTSVPPTALGRLQAIQARLDATYHAILSIQVGLAGFEKHLSDEQKTRFQATDFASR
jgi:LTXXQ motif family protein